MTTITSSDAAIQRRATISQDEPQVHVVFWLNETQAAHRKPGKTYKTLHAAHTAAARWVAEGK